LYGLSNHKVNPRN